MPADDNSETGARAQEVGLLVNYDGATVDVSKEAAVIFYSMKGPGDPELPRQVKWVAQDLKQGDEITIRAKAVESKEIFIPGEFKLFWPHVAVTSGEPVDPFKGTEESTVEWIYEIVVSREGEPLFIRDPVVLIEREG